MTIGFKIKRGLFFIIL